MSPLALLNRYLLTASAVGIIGLVACGPPASNKTELVFCQAGQDRCPGESDQTSKAKSSGGSNSNSPSDSVTSPTPAAAAAAPPTPTPPPATPADAGTGTDAGAIVIPDDLGPSCTRLKGCCDAFVAQGVYADFCLQALSTGNESTCDDKYQSYMTDPEGTVCPATP